MKPSEEVKRIAQERTSYRSSEPTLWDILEYLDAQAGGATVSEREVVGPSAADVTVEEWEAIDWCIARAAEPNTGHAKEQIRQAVAGLRKLTSLAEEHRATQPESSGGGEDEDSVARDLLCMLQVARTPGNVQAAKRELEKARELGARAAAREEHERNLREASCFDATHHVLKEKLAAAERRLNNLLARIHRDGGHYVGRHGVEKASADAEMLVSGMLESEERAEKAEAERDGLRAWLAEHGSFVVDCLRSESRKLKDRNAGYDSRPRVAALLAASESLDALTKEAKP